MYNSLYSKKGRFIIVAFKDGVEHQSRSSSRNMKWHFEILDHPDLLLCYTGAGKLLTVFRKFDGLDAGEYLSPDLFPEYQNVKGVCYE